MKIGTTPAPSRMAGTPEDFAAKFSAALIITPRKVHIGAFA